MKYRFLFDGGESSVEAASLAEAWELFWLRHPDVIGYVQCVTDWGWLADSTSYPRCV